MSKKILIVDDDQALIKTVQPLLQGQGFEVLIAADGEEGLEQVKAHHPDLIILDVQMPKMNGYSFVFELKKIDNAKKTPIIVLTAKEGMAEIFKVEGVKEYLTKPLSPTALLQSVSKYVSK